MALEALPQQHGSDHGGGTGSVVLRTWLKVGCRWLVWMSKKSIRRGRGKELYEKQGIGRVDTNKEFCPCGSVTVLSLVKDEPPKYSCHRIALELIRRDTYSWIIPNRMSTDKKLPSLKHSMFQGSVRSCC